MTRPVDFPCVVLAGGASLRFGKPKGLALLEGQPLIQHVISGAQKQTRAPVVINTAPDGPYAKFGTTIADPVAFRDCGPLAGILSGLTWAARAGFDKIATVPLDAPLLPSSLLRWLQGCSAPSFATTQGRPHYVIGLWPVAHRPDLEHFLRDGRRSMRDWVETCGAKSCLFDADGIEDAFININTQSDLRILRKN